MSEEVISRVDDLIRKNNIKYKDQQEQKVYEEALKQYEKQAQIQYTRQYASVIKEGNRKAVQKTKELKALTKKQKRPKKQSLTVIPIKEIQKPPVYQHKYSQDQINMFNKTEEARAERILQQNQLSKLSKRLEQQKKRTKLFQLNQKCKKMLSKSHQRIVPARGVPADRMEALKQYEEKAFGEIKELDNIIESLVDKANNAKNPQRAQSSRNLKIPIAEQTQKLVKQREWLNEQDLVDLQKIAQSGESQLDGFMSLNTLIFQKSTEELLSLNYIPI